jgi:hypothetical protein
MSKINKILDDIEEKIEKIEKILNFQPSRLMSDSKASSAMSDSKASSAMSDSKVSSSMSDSKASSFTSFIEESFIIQEKSFNKISNLNNTGKILINIFPWFHKCFGFTETNDYLYNQQKIKYLFHVGKYKKIGRYDVGNFKLFRFSGYSQINNCLLGNVTIKNIKGNIIKIHEATLYNNSTIQVASQLNCLEMENTLITPENGITIYQNDGTQGPRCALRTPSGIAYRNYLIPITNESYGQTHNNQLNMADELLIFLKKQDHKIQYIYKNGYLFIDNFNLKKINNILKINMMYNISITLIKTASHTGMGVCDRNYNFIENQHINHVLCSGLPIYYNKGYYEKDVWDLLSGVFLKAFYKNTLLIACNNNKIYGDKPCFLTQIGGGVFDMKHSIIIEAIQYAVEYIKNLGYKLNIYIVHYINENSNRKQLDAFELYKTSFGEPIDLGLDILP